MAHAEVCPVCWGTGKARRFGATDLTEEWVNCHGCGGKGWVEVSDNSPHYPRPYPQPEPAPTPWTPIITCSVTLGGGA